MGKFTARIENGRVNNIIKYTPEHTKPGSGQKISAMAVIPTLINDDPYLDDAGKLVEGGKVLCFVTVWGKLADTCAKYLGIGKEYSCVCNVKSFSSKIMDEVTNKAILNSVGKPAQTIKQGYTMIPSSFQFGNDSANQIQKENRPLGWDGKLSFADIEMALAAGTLGNVLAQAKQGPAMWDKLRADLKALTYTAGMTEFGKAQVVLPEGMVPAPNAYDLAKQIAAATGTPNVDGHTYEALKKVGWTDEQLLTTHGGKYACLVPKATPLPPTAPAAPPAPDKVEIPEAMEMTAGEGTTATV